MTQETGLAVREQAALSLQDTMTVAQMMAQSGFFADTKQAAQAVVKILKGQELGIGPVTSMTSIHIIQGKITVGADILAGLIRASGRYDYRILHLDDEGCEIEFYDRGRAIGRSAFVKADAQRAGLLSKPIWQQYPRNMYFSRAMTNGHGWFCPDVGGGGKVYNTPEELGATVDGDGQVIDVPATPVSTPAPTAPTAPTHAAPTPEPKDGDRQQRPSDRMASVSPKLKNWNAAAEELAQNEAYYALPGGGPDYPHIRAALYSLSFTMVTPDNLETCLDALRTHAHEKQCEAEKAAGQQEMSLYPEEGGLE